MTRYSPEQLLPHRSPALLIDRILECSAEQVKTSVTFPENGSPLLLVEASAQSVAALLGGAEAASGKPAAEGYLVGVKDFAWQGAFRPGEVIITVRQERSLAPFYIFHAAVAQDGLAVAEGYLTLFKKEDVNHAAAI